MTKFAQFYVDCDELREAGFRVNENITGIMRPPSIKDLFERIRVIYDRRERETADGKCAEAEGDTYLAGRCRDEVATINEIFAIWKARWRAL